MTKAWRKALDDLEALRSRLALNGADDAELQQIAATLRAAPHRANRLEMARRVEKLDRQLADRPAGERNAAIIERLGISKSTLFELRSVRESPDWPVVE